MLQVGIREYIHHYNHDRIRTKPKDPIVTVQLLWINSQIIFFYFQYPTATLGTDH